MYLYVHHLHSRSLSDYSTDMNVTQLLLVHMLVPPPGIEYEYQLPAQMALDAPSPPAQGPNQLPYQILSHVYVPC
jgi:hypothetical protein